MIHFIKQQILNKVFFIDVVNVKEFNITFIDILLELFICKLIKFNMH